jgi:hypothetical protein
VKDEDAVGKKCPEMVMKRLFNTLLRFPKKVKVENILKSSFIFSENSN